MSASIQSIVEIKINGTQRKSIKHDTESIVTLHFCVYLDLL